MSNLPAKPTSKNGVVLYRGPSEIDGAPIVMIATGLQSNSRNAKTGNIVQTWIMCDDVAPMVAVNTGDDASICGACPHRGKIVDGKNVGRSCYVTLFQAPRNIWQTYKDGKYPVAKYRTMPDILAGRRVRLGAYGDPAAVPVAVWDHLLQHVDGVTGYTHQWRTCDVAISKWCMASADTVADLEYARNIGYRVFRVRGATDPLQANEIVCPASNEYEATGKTKTNCAACMLCGGNSKRAGKDVAIIAHGAASKVNAFTTRNAFGFIE